MEAKPIEVIMRIDFAASNGTEIVAHTEKVGELIRCEHCTCWTRDRGGKDQPYGYCRVGGKAVTKYKYDYCSSGKRREDG